MKIEITKPRHLNSLNRTVKPGDILESPADASEKLLQVYVDNGIARILTTSPPRKDVHEPQNTGGE